MPSLMKQSMRREGKRLCLNIFCTCSRDKNEKGQQAIISALLPSDHTFSPLPSLCNRYAFICSDCYYVNILFSLSAFLGEIVNKRTVWWSVYSVKIRLMLNKSDRFIICWPRRYCSHWTVVAKEKKQTKIWSQLIYGSIFRSIATHH
jgi:hypothetical protein